MSNVEIALAIGVPIAGAMTWLAYNKPAEYLRLGLIIMAILAAISFPLSIWMAAVVSIFDALDPIVGLSRNPAAVQAIAPLLPPRWVLPVIGVLTVLNFFLLALPKLLGKQYRPTEQRSPTEAAPENRPGR